MAQVGFAAVDGNATLEKVDKNLTPGSYEMYCKLINIEPDGKRKEFMLYAAKQNRDRVVGLYLGPSTDSGRTTLSKSPPHLAGHRDDYAGKTVVSFCTGGIRCEKAAIHMLAIGIERVYQLEGGIIAATASYSTRARR